MKILALEFSTDQRSVAVVVDGDPRGYAMESLTRSSHPIQLIETALAQAGLERESIECLAIGIGPGSYTGIRGAIALAQGWQLGNNIKLLGVSSVECMAAQALELGWWGSVRLGVDAQRDDLYLAGYEISELGCKITQPLEIISAATIRTTLREGERIAGPEIQRWFPKGETLFPDARMLGQIAETRTDFVAGETLTPIYLREIAFVKAPPCRVI